MLFRSVAMGLQARAIEAQVSNTEADTALKMAQAAKEAGEASKKPIELKIEQTNKEIADLEKSLKTQNVEIGANEIVRTTAVAQKAMEELNQAMMETEIKKGRRSIKKANRVKNRTNKHRYRDWETDRKSTRLNSSHEIPSRMPSSA